MSCDELLNAPAEQAAAHRETCASCRAEGEVLKRLSLGEPSREDARALERLRAPEVSAPARRRSPFAIPAAALAGAAFTFLVLHGRPVEVSAPAVITAEPVTEAVGDPLGEVAFLDADEFSDGEDADDFDVEAAEVSWSADPDVEVDP